MESFHIELGLVRWTPQAGSTYLGDQKLPITVLRNSDQKQRWLATALHDLEPQLRRVKNYHALPLLQRALQQHVEEGKQSAA